MTGVRGEGGVTAAIGRRRFIGGLAAFGLGGCSTAPFGCGAGRLRVGVLSDVHVKEPLDPAAGTVSSAYWGDGCRNGWPTSAETFRRALVYFRERRADAVLIAGDIVDLGLRPQFETLKRIWNEVFPGGLLPDGRRVEKIWVTGNHEWGGWRYNCVKRVWPAEETRRRMSFVSDPEGFWREFAGEEFRPLFVKDVKGYKFVCAHYAGPGGVPELPRFIDGVKAHLPADKPFFYVQHLHPKGTCSSPFAASDDGTSTRVLSDFPNAVAFTGHSHRSLTDERTIWQGAFTSVGTASLRFVQCSPGCDNGNETPGAASVKSPLLPPVDAYEGRQGMFMTVYDDAIRLERREFLYGERLADDWVIPTGVAGRPFAPAYRAEREKAPEFAPGAAVKTVKCRGRDRSGAERDFVSAVFPTALSGAGRTRALEYEVRALAGGSAVAEKRVFSAGSLLPPNRDGWDVVCRFAAEELPASGVRFEVRARGAFGALSAPIRG